MPQKKDKNHPKRQSQETPKDEDENPRLPRKKTTRQPRKVWRKNLNYKGDWIVEVHGTMMLVATVIATVAFQAAINPPGGVWQQDTQHNSSNYIDQYYQMGLLYEDYRNGTIFRAGTAIMAYQKRAHYLIYLVAIMVSFLASLSVILLIISRVQLKNRLCSGILVLAMCAAVVFLAIGYLLGVTMVNSPAIFGDQPANTGYKVTISSWYVMVSVVGFCHIIGFLLWVVKSKLKSHNFNLTTTKRR